MSALEAPAPRAIGIEAVGMTKRFGSLLALDNVSLKVRPGEFHALLGENGAGKSTLVKCIMGFYQPTAGQLIVGQHEVVVRSPSEARDAGIGMVYQHFTVVPALTAAENMVVSRADTPAIINWSREVAAIERFMATMPFTVPLHTPVAALSAGERQKLEILKQLYLDQHFLILDEPTSVLTPGEADEVLGLLKAMAESGDITVLMITHKFREVFAFADQVTVLRRGRTAGAGAVSDMTAETLSAMMIGETKVRTAADRSAPARRGATLKLSAFTVREGDRTLVDKVDLEVPSGQIVGIAGVSGNGQSALLEGLSGQRPFTGSVTIDDVPFDCSRGAYDRFKVFGLPEEPLKNAAVGRMSVAENMALRTFDKPPIAPSLAWLRPSVMRTRADTLIGRYRVKTPSADAPMETLSGGNVQRAVLARELSGEVDILIVANPCFGLDFASVAEIRAQLIDQRNRGAAVLLISEDLDEILELSDTVAVMSEGRIVFSAPASGADRQTIGTHMAGH
ncbi:MAG: ABC transporter ATP-binding protein [Pseudomonadota bacterium]